MTDATIRAKSAKMQQLIEQTAISAPGDDPPWIHSDVYLQISEEGVRTLVSSGGGSVLTYHTYSPDFFDNVETDGESVSAILNVERTTDYLAVATDDELADFVFSVPEGEMLAETLEAYGALNMSVSLPAAEKTLDKVPEELPERWDDDENLLSPSGNEHSTHISTTAETIQKIIDAVELADGTEFYPISVEDKTLQLDVRNENSTDKLWGELGADVEGPGLKNWYGPGFVPVLENTISGQVELQTSAAGGDGAPMAIVQEGSQKTIRYVLVQVNPS